MYKSAQTYQNQGKGDTNVTFLAYANRNLCSFASNLFIKFVAIVPFGNVLEFTFDQIAVLFEKVDVLVLRLVRSAVLIDPVFDHFRVAFVAGQYLTVKPFKVISATSWLAYGGYAAQKMLTPSSFAPQVMTLKGDRKEIKVTM